MSALEQPGYVVRPLRRAEYERLVDAGAFENERVELLEGFLVEMSPQRASRASAIEVLTELLYTARQPGQKVRVRLPLALGDDSEPEPDLCIENRRVEMRTQPEGGVYLRQETVASGGQLLSSSVPELKLSVDTIFAG